MVSEPPAPNLTAARELALILKELRSDTSIDTIVII